VEILDAARTAPAAAICLNDVAAKFLAIGEETGANFAAVLDFVVPIFGDAAAQFGAREPAPDRDGDAKVAAVLMRIDCRSFGYDLRIQGETDRNAIFRIMMIEGKTDVQVALHIGKAAGNVVDPPGGVGKLIPQLRQFLNCRIWAGLRFFP